jgi:hypothetical protein
MANACQPQFLPVQKGLEQCAKNLYPTQALGHPGLYSTTYRFQILGAFNILLATLVMIISV